MCVCRMYVHDILYFYRQAIDLVLDPNMNLTGQYYIKTISPLYQRIRQSLCQFALKHFVSNASNIEESEHARKHTYNDVSEPASFDGNQISQKCGQIDPTPCGSILHASRASQVL